MTAAALQIIAKLKSVAPYAVIELVLPGGSLLALVLWLYRRRREATRSSLPIAIEYTAQ